MGALAPHLSHVVRPAFFLIQDISSLVENQINVFVGILFLHWLCRGLSIRHELSRREEAFQNTLVLKVYVTLNKFHRLPGFLTFERYII